MFSSWDLVQPTFWHPMSSLEQSMMELDHMSDFMTRSRFPFDLDREMLTAPNNVDDDDFFRDLPMQARDQRAKRSTKDSDMESAAESEAAPDNDSNKSMTDSTNDNDNDNNQHRRAFSSYSFSDSSVVDDKGRRVTSTRRRYEDSTGRLKAVHEREIEGKKLRSTWNRLNQEDEGKHESVCSNGSATEFEALWQQTPFGEAQKKTIKQHGERQQQQEQPKLEQKSNTALEDAPMDD
ncbi:hypothetical protein G195_011246 [Phytophthora kernoviae 00238/432]|uniref:Uncharacterized protein n=2 Tax=Phytophthora kernoviae TaxID=325452 RepID=A0A8T0LI93_9STRA|nr:hypothetical protein G195_011246 [Phytophthora kernoviae 00238/432]KAG2502902.1 hypothetical protein JM16_009431 [Phytophthora kernoviae]